MIYVTLNNFVLLLITLYDLKKSSLTLSNSVRPSMMLYDLKELCMTLNHLVQSDIKNEDSIPISKSDFCSLSTRNIMIRGKQKN